MDNAKYFHGFEDMAVNLCKQLNEFCKSVALIGFRFLFMIIRVHIWTTGLCRNLDYFSQNVALAIYFILFNSKLGKHSMWQRIVWLPSWEVCYNLYFYCLVESFFLHPSLKIYWFCPGRGSSFTALLWLLHTILHVQFCLCSYIVVVIGEGVG